MGSIPRNNIFLVREKVAESRKSKEKIYELEAKVSQLEEQLKTEKNDFREQKALVLSNVSFMRRRNLFMFLCRRWNKVRLIVQIFLVSKKR